MSAWMINGLKKKENIDEDDEAHRRRVRMGEKTSPLRKPGYRANEPVRSRNVDNEYRRREEDEKRKK